MNPTYYRKTAAGDGGISFPSLECWNPVTKVATIAAQVDADRVSCRVSMEILQERFDAFSEEPLQVLKQNRSAIEAAARKLIENEAYEEDGSIIIQKKDI
jgi:hypothetical protein